MRLPHEPRSFRLVRGAAYFVAAACASALLVMFSSPILVDALKQSGGCLVLGAEERTECYEDTFPSLYPEYSIGEIFRMIHVLQPYEPALADCHFIAHALGERVVRDDPTRWPEFIREELPESICAGGYVHGLTIAAYDHTGLSDEEIEPELPKFREACTGMRQNDRLICMHGLGHMLYYITGGEVRRSLQLCDRVMHDADPEQTFNPARQCQTAVMMMLLFSFIDPEWEPSPHYQLTRENIREFCLTFEKSSHRGACLRGSWPLFPESIESAENIARFCEGQPDAHEETWCYMKLFVATTWKNLNDFEHMRAICAQTASERQELCRQYVTREILAEGGIKRLPDAVRLCGMFDDAGSESCFQILARESGRYTGEGEGYISRDAYCRELPERWRERCAASRER